MHRIHLPHIQSESWDKTKPLNPVWIQTVSSLICNWYGALIRKRPWCLTRAYIIKKKLQYLNFNSNIDYSWFYHFQWIICSSIFTNFSIISSQYWWKRRPGSSPCIGIYRYAPHTRLLLLAAIRGLKPCMECRGGCNLQYIYRPSANRSQVLCTHSICILDPLPDIDMCVSRTKALLLLLLLT